MASEKKTYKIARGYAKNYMPETTHKDMIYACIDKRVIYLNGVGYDGCGLIISVKSRYTTISDLTGMANPENGVAYYCDEDKNIYQYLDRAWHTRELKRGDFLNFEDYRDGNAIYENKLFYFNGNDLSDEYEGVTDYLLDTVNNIQNWFEGE